MQSRARLGTRSHYGRTMTEILRSQIHLVLGTTAPLDFAMIEQAVDARVQETDTLDWKVALHDNAVEFAKDVVAFANARGGLLVIGVGESKGAASKVVGLEFSDAIERKLRGWLSNHVQPTLHDLSFRFLPDPKSEEGHGVLAINVPASPGIPHLVATVAGQERLTSWPRRNGTRTEWMREYDIERAYQDRFARRTTDEKALASMLELVMDQLDRNISPWVLAAARPTNPAPATVPPPSPQQITDVLVEAIQQSASVRPQGNRYPTSTIQVLGQTGNAPKVGLRRWVMHSHALNTPDALSDFGHVEIHHDGSILVAAPVGRWATSISGKCPIPDWALGGLIADLVCLIDGVSEIRGIDTGYAVRLEPKQAGGDPFALTSAWDFNWQSKDEVQVHRSLDVRRYIPVETELPAMIHDPSRQHAAWTLMRDAIAQFGVEPHDIGWPNPDAST